MLLALGAGAGTACASTIEGRVIEVPDGASLTLLASAGASIHRVRLAGIVVPSPETVAGGSARASLRRLLSGKPVKVETNAIDAAGNLVGFVTIAPNLPCATPDCNDDSDPAIAQLRSGLAWIEQTGLLQQSAEIQARYAAAVALAQKKRLGLWRDYILTRNGRLRERRTTLPPAIRQPDGTYLIPR